MHLILLERIAHLGQMGDEVRVRDGFARNYLLPQGKALRSSDANRKQFESQRAQLETRNLEQKSEAEAVAAKLDGQSFVLVRQAAETGQLYGSVTTRDLAEAVTEAGFTVGRGQVDLSHPIKAVGMHSVAISLHPDVIAKIVANIARSADEAARQAKGEDITRPGADAEQSTPAERSAGEEPEGSDQTVADAAEEIDAAQSEGGTSEPTGSEPENGTGLANDEAGKS